MIIKSRTSYTIPTDANGNRIGHVEEGARKAIDQILQAGKIESLRHSLTGIELDDFQTMIPAVAYLSKSFCIGADTGLGKSLMLALYLKIHLGKGTLNPYQKALVVTTNASLNQIKSTIEKTTGLKVKHLPGDANQLYKIIREEDLTKYNVFIVANSVFGKAVEFSRLFAHMAHTVNTFICDESMVTANDSTYTHLAIKYWMKNCEYKLFLNATVIEKNLKQLHTQMSLLDSSILEPLESLESKHAVYTSGGRGQKRKFMGYRDLNLLIKKLPYHFANVNRDVLGKEFPSINHLVPLQMTPLQASVVNGKNYNYALFSPTTQAETSIIPFDLFNVPALYKTIEIVKSEFEKRGKGIVIYAEPVACKEVLEKHIKENVPGAKVGIIDGQTVDKDYTRQAFNRGNIHILIINIQEALDLTAGEVMIVYTLPSKNIQLRARITRGLNPDVNDPKVYYYLVYLNSPQSTYLVDTMLVEERISNHSLERTYYNSVAQLVEQLVPLENLTQKRLR